MDEHAAKRILFDFEVIVLVALGVGLMIYAVFRPVRRELFPGMIGANFGRLDLALVWVPLALFLINPILVFLSPQLLTPPSPAEGVEETAGRSQLDQIATVAAQLFFFVIIGLTTLFVLVFGNFVNTNNENENANANTATESRPPRIRDDWSLRNVVDLLGLRRMKFLPILIIALGGTCLSYLVCNVVLGTLSSSFLTENMGKLEAQQAVEEMKNAQSPPVIFVSLLLACVAAPIVEETLFRGYFYGVLKRFSSPIFAAMISSALFAVVHLNLPALVPLWTFALILTLSYELTRCLWVPILIHALFNAVNVSMLFGERFASNL